MRDHLVILVGLLVLCLAEYVPPGPRYNCPTGHGKEKEQLLYPCICNKGSDLGLYIQCENTNLASLAVGLSNLAALQAPVESLTIRSSNIGRLYGDLLYALDVRILRIENTPIKSIEPNTFLGINKTLQEFHLIHSKLQSFPKEAFQILGNLSVLHIDGHSITSLPKDAFSIGLLSSHLQRYHLVNGNLSELPVETLAVNQKLKTLDLHGNQLKNLKRNQFKGLRNVEILDLSHNLIVKVDASHLPDLNKLTVCNLSHNALTEITRGAFARNSVLRSLNLSYNKISKLDTNSFKGMRFIRRLYLSDNRITDVARGTFASVSRIGTIDLARNKLTKIDYQMFHQLQYVEVIDVSSNLVTEIKKLAFKDLYLVAINLSNNGIEKIESGAFENCANITHLDFSNNKIQKFPPDAFDSITYATELQLSFNQFTDLSQVPLGNMSGLKILNVSNNHLAVIPRNTFPKLYELHTIDLNNNVITEIANTVFQTLFGLRFLNLSYNSLEVIKSSTFGTLPTLLELDLSYNKIEDVSRGALANLASLQRLHLHHNFISKIFQLSISLSNLDLSNNRITNIPLNTWPSMNALLSLDLSDNQLEDNLVKGSLSPLLTLRILNLNRNGITKPPWESLSDLSSVQYIYMENNSLVELGRGAFGRLPVVFELNLSKNQISNISQYAFDGLLQLLTLNLSSNNLSFIPNGAFHGLVSLSKLDLSHNALEVFDNKTHGLFDDLLSLDTLNLSSNKISFVTRKSFPSNPWIKYKLHHLDMSYNSIPVLAYDMTFGTRELISLNLSHNMINEIRRAVIGNLTSIQTLDLSYNELDDLSGANIFSLPTNISYLSLKHNHLHTIPLKEIVKARSLRYLDLSYNQLEHFFNDLLPMVRKGVNLLYEGNPLNCDCTLRPVRRWALNSLEPNINWKPVLCRFPLRLQNKTVLSTPEKDLFCTGLQETEDPEYDVTPDVKFRDIYLTEKGGIHLSWFVNTKEDIAEFKVVVYNPNNGNNTLTQDNVLERMLPYNTRSYILSNIPKKENNMELCVLVLDSDGNIKEPVHSQCKPLPVVNSTSKAAIIYYVFIVIIITYFV